MESRRPAVLLGCSCIAWIAFIWLWEPAYLALTVDDSFYYLQIARHVAAGEGFTFDGLNPTNGFHPLWLLVLSGLAWLFSCSPAVLMRVALTLQVLMVWGGIELLGRAHRPLMPWIRLAASLLLLHFYFVKSLVNGMESALSFFLMAAALAVWTSGPERLRTRSLVLGKLAGLCAMARLEAVLFSLCVVALPPEGAHEPRATNRWLRQPMLWLVPLVIVVGYFGANRLLFDHWLPVSSAIKSEEGLMGFGPQRLERAGLVSAGAIGFGLYLYWASRDPARRAFSRLWAPVGVYAFGSLVLYQLIEGRIPPIWYLVPWSLLLVMIASLLLSSAASSSRWRPVVTALSILWLVWCGFTWQHRLDRSSYSAPIQARENGRWLQTNTPEDSLAAGWASGIASAHSGRRLINLDGLANSWDYKEDYLDQGNTQEFIDAVWPVDYLAVYFDVESLAYFADKGYRGVEIASWGVARAECTDFRSILRSRRTRRLLYVVLQRDPPHGLTSFERFVSSGEGACAGHSVLKPPTLPRALPTRSRLSPRP